MADNTWFDAKQREIEEEIKRRVDDDYRDSSDEECEVAE